MCVPTYICNQSCCLASKEINLFIFFKTSSQSMYSSFHFFFHTLNKFRRGFDLIIFFISLITYTVYDLFIRVYWFENTFIEIIFLWSPSFLVFKLAILFARSTLKFHSKIDFVVSDILYRCIYGFLAGLCILFILKGCSVKLVFVQSIFIVGGEILNTF